MSITIADPALDLRAVVDRMQMAGHGSTELDVLLEDALERAIDLAGVDATWCGGPPTGGARWSTDLGDAFALLPRDYNFSLGYRDGVSWAWIQPNDRWEPAEYEARHDHPGGSGLVVARTAALALTCAAIILRIRRMEGATRDTPPLPVPVA